MGLLVCCVGQLGDCLILANLAVATFFMSVAAGATIESPAGRLSLQQKDASIRAHMAVATSCIVRGVEADSRFRKQDPSHQLGDIIVDAIPQCIAPLRAMIDAHDLYFGEGSGEDFFMGAYLDLLPTAVLKKVHADGPKELLPPAGAAGSQPRVR
jgi:hypothetical protein